MSELRYSTYAFLEKFQCLGAECEDTCCKGWVMQVDQSTVERYNADAPELLDAIISDDEGSAMATPSSKQYKYRMQRDAETDYCVKYDKGWCKIHADYGTSFLGDACHFFPRVTRQFSDRVIMGASLGCPQVVRDILSKEDAFILEPATIERTPFHMVDYGQDIESGQGRVEALEALIAMAGDESVTPERIMARIAVIMQSLESFDPSQWDEVIPFLIKTADSRLVAPVPDANDGYFLMQTLYALMYAAKKVNRPRLEDVFAMIETSLGAIIDRKSLDIMIIQGKQHLPDALLARWKQGADVDMAPLLRKWIQAQLALSSMPYAGFGEGPFNKAVVLCVRFATLKQALMAHMSAEGAPPAMEDVVRIIQSLSRFVDHLADPELSLNMYKDAGWTQMGRLESLVGDI